jgi:hypothetical protein
MQDAVVPNRPMPSLSTVVDRTYPVDDPGALYLRAEALLADHGFAVQQVEPPLVGMAGVQFKGGLRGERDVVVDAMRRKIGKWLVISASVMTVLTLWVMVSGPQPYWVFDWLLTIEVLMGGIGLMQLRNPADRRRTVVEIAMAGQADGLHVAVQEGVGKVEDDVIFDWLQGEPVAVQPNEIDALLSSTKRDEASG